MASSTCSSSDVSRRRSLKNQRELDRWTTWPHLSSAAPSIAGCAKSWISTVSSTASTSMVSKPLPGMVGSAGLCCHLASVTALRSTSMGRLRHSLAWYPFERPDKSDHGLGRLLCLATSSSQTKARGEGGRRKRMAAPHLTACALARSMCACSRLPLVQRVRSSGRAPEATSYVKPSNRSTSGASGASTSFTSTTSSSSTSASSASAASAASSSASSASSSSSSSGGGSGGSQATGGQSGPCCQVRPCAYVTTSSFSMSSLVPPTRCNVL
eukprot:scaffold123436_cov60-Phaeocystis_antarctica.AAC.2